MTEQGPSGGGIPEAFRDFVEVMDDEAHFFDREATSEEEFRFGVKYDDLEYYAEMFDRRREALIEGEKFKSELAENETPRIVRISERLTEARKEFKDKPQNTVLSLSANDVAYIREKTYNLGRGLTKREQEMINKCRDSLTGSFKKFLRATKNEATFKEIFPNENFKRWFGN